MLELRERFGVGRRLRVRRASSCQWFVHGEVTDSRAPVGVEGPDGVLTLAEHFREHGQDPRAYAQADDIWSIGRHRAFLARHAAAVAAQTEDGELAVWVQEHGETLAKRWSHMAPLLMQATLALAAGRAPSASVPDTLEDLAARELAAKQALPLDVDLCNL